MWTNFHCFFPPSFLPPSLLLHSPKPGIHPFFLSFFPTPIQSVTTSCCSSLLNIIQTRPLLFILPFQKFRPSSSLPVLIRLSPGWYPLILASSPIHPWDSCQRDSSLRKVLPELGVGSREEGGVKREEDPKSGSQRGTLQGKQTCLPFKPSPVSSWNLQSDLHFSPLEFIWL